MALVLMVMVLIGKQIRIQCISLLVLRSEPARSGYGIVPTLIVILVQSVLLLLQNRIQILDCLVLSCHCNSTRFVSFFRYNSNVNCFLFPLGFFFNFFPFSLTKCNKPSTDAHLFRKTNVGIKNTTKEI